MSDFKHIVVVNGAKDSLLRFAKEAVGLGYHKRLLDCAEVSKNGYSLVLNRKVSSGNYQTVESGDVNYYSNSNDYWKKKGVKYAFNIDNENEYKAALAIAAMREGNEYHVGEWTAFNDKNITGGRDEMRLIMPNDATWPSNSNCCSLEAAKWYKSYRKATPEEIIAFFNTNTQNKMEKKIIGYKAPFDLFENRVKSGSIFSKSTAEGNPFYFAKGGPVGIPREIVETWEPAYEEEAETIIIGSRAVRVTISRGKIEAAKSLWSIDRLNSVINHLVAIPTMVVYDVYLEDRDTRYIRIGCTEENNRFSLNELISVKKLYDKINK